MKKRKPFIFLLVAVLLFVVNPAHAHATGDSPQGGGDTSAGVDFDANVGATSMIQGKIGGDAAAVGLGGEGIGYSSANNAFDFNFGQDIVLEDGDTEMSLGLDIDNPVDLSVIDNSEIGLSLNFEDSPQATAQSFVSPKTQLATLFSYEGSKFPQLNTLALTWYQFPIKDEGTTSMGRMDVTYAFADIKEEIKKHGVQKLPKDEQKIETDVLGQRVEGVVVGTIMLQPEKKHGRTVNANTAKKVAVRLVSKKYGCEYPFRLVSIHELSGLYYGIDAGSKGFSLSSTISSLVENAPLGAVSSLTGLAGGGSTLKGITVPAAYYHTTYFVVLKTKAPKTAMHLRLDYDNALLYVAKQKIRQKILVTKLKKKLEKLMKDDEDDEDGKGKGKNGKNKALKMKATQK